MPANDPYPATSLSPDDVRRAVVALLGRDITDLTFASAPVDPELRLHAVTAGVLRVRGRADGEDFSIVVKQTHSAPEDPSVLWGSGADESHQHYWKREWLAYASGLLAGLPGRLRAPRLLLAIEPDDGVAWFWIEDVAGMPGAQWQTAQYARAAHDLGTTQGAFAAGRPGLPGDPWLSRGWLSDWVATAARSWPLVDDDAAWRDERLAVLAVLRPRAREVWAEQERLLALVAAAPRTLVHLDFWPNNLIAATDGSTVAIDWSSVGLGALGQDLDQLTLDPVWMQILPGADLAVLEETVLAAYASGVRAAGHAVSDAELRRSYAAAAGLRYVSMLAAQAEIVADTRRVEGLELRWGRPFAAIAADRARVLERAISLAEEALD
jgi:Phosphotransferase enzyme family